MTLAKQSIMLENQLDKGCFRENESGSLLGPEKNILYKISYINHLTLLLADQKTVHQKWNYFVEPRQIAFMIHDTINAL